MIDVFPISNWSARDNIEANKNQVVEHLNGLLTHALNYIDDLDFTILAEKTINNEYHYLSDKFRGLQKRTESLQEKNSFSLHSAKEDKSFRVVVKNIHPKTPHEMFQQDIEQQGNFIVRQITLLISKGLLPLHFVDLEKNATNKDLFHIKKIAYFKALIVIGALSMGSCL